MEPIISEARSRMQKAYEVMHQDFSSVRSGKANSSLVENIMISAYGGAEKLRVIELATISIQDPHTIIVSPFDNSIIGEIVKGIQDAKVGLSPILESELIRINLPPLTEERRLEFVKLIHQKAENGRVMIRQVRQEAMNDAKRAGATFSEDEVDRVEKEVQRLTDEFTTKIDTLAKEKEEELMKM